MQASVKTREDRVRRELAKHDLSLKKTPHRSSLRQYYGADYMIIDPYSNCVVSGAFQPALDAMSDDAVREYGKMVTDYLIDRPEPSAAA